MLQTLVVEKIKMDTLCSIAFPPKPCHLWDAKKFGKARQATNNNIIWPMCTACWTTKTTDTHSEYVILIGVPRHKQLCKHVCILLVLFMLYLLPCQYQEYTASTTDKWAWTLSNGRMIDETRNQNYTRKTMYQWNSVHHKSHMWHAVIKPRHLQLATGN
jgi:hypothetical protein